MKVVCFDLDMTLLDHHTGEISRSTLHTIELLRQTAKIVLATGRNMRLADHAQYIELLQPDAIIHMNGTRVETEGILLFEQLLDPGHIQAIAAKAYEMKWCIGHTQDNIMYTTSRQTIIDRDMKRLGRCDRSFGELRDVLNDDFHSLTVWEDSESIDRMAAEFPMVSFNKFSEAFGADIVPLQISKATGMRYLLERWGYEFKDVISVGDSMNDYELIKQSGTGIAMGNADPVLKEAADLVTDDIGKDGIQKAFARLGIV
ncbi:HAD family hydrolase [Paenibacillus sp. MMS20-IR301]|uniref:HAD family hydrolase n=1 Tax=Paenibacillus sp. MMS20-IR301 TaxID=2895946 RepID=UPI0028EDEFBC|nr:HAD family hydrolase [Paenibacillus sp. MMS20-IR301]WNS43132.1 HAD family hydrolase [Paenibacillus sp. MMS20-IR301]